MAWRGLTCLGISRTHSILGYSPTVSLMHSARQASKIVRDKGSCRSQPKAMQLHQQSALGHCPWLVNKSAAGDFCQIKTYDEAPVGPSAVLLPHGVPCGAGGAQKATRNNTKASGTGAKEQGGAAMPCSCLKCMGATVALRSLSGRFLVRNGPI